MMDQTIICDACAQEMPVADATDSAHGGVLCPACADAACEAMLDVETAQ